jgi:hypothetical protein
VIARARTKIADHIDAALDSLEKYGVLSRNPSQWSCGLEVVVVQHPAQPT